MSGHDDGRLTLDTPLELALDGGFAALLHKELELYRVGDLLHHYPRSYATRGELTAIKGIPAGEHVTLIAVVQQVEVRAMRSRSGKLVEVTIFDGSATAKLAFFNQPWRARQLQRGQLGMFSGKATVHKGTVQLAHPDFQMFDEQDERWPLPGGAPAGGVADSRAAAQQWTQELLPIYPATQRVSSWQLQAAIQRLLDRLPPLPEPVPPRFSRQLGLLGFDAALRTLHAPRTREELDPARDALRFVEALVLQTALLQAKQLAATVAAAPRPLLAGGLVDRFDAAAPFQFTGDQRRVGAEIARELDRPVAMQRLVQGEVGSGKTIVAVRAMLQVADTGGQCVLLAPTEVLAAQHLRSITAALGPELSAELAPALLTGGMGAAERRQALLRIATGDARIVIGTHALLGDGVSFSDLGMVVIDEQHRFGVDQRERMRAKGSLPPHLLVLSATPIPRTVAMTAFGDLDVSTMTELPGGRSPIASHVVPTAEHPRWLERAWQRLGEEVAAGRQAFIVCPAIEEEQPSRGATPGGRPIPARPVANVTAVLEQARRRPELAGRRVELLHGRLPSPEKDAVMRRFAEGAIDVLVSTTVIEVGVDVPNATVMMVLDADRFGVSQLHQLRGRVGRGEHPGLCLLVTGAGPVSAARERLGAVAATLDGFELAQRDLELRREGDVLGTAQSGASSSLRLLRVTRDGEIIEWARAVAGELLAADPGLDAPEHLPLAGEVGRIRAEQRHHLATG